MCFNSRLSATGKPKQSDKCHLPGSKALASVTFLSDILHSIIFRCAFLSVHVRQEKHVNTDQLKLWLTSGRDDIDNKTSVPAILRFSFFRVRLDTDLFRLLILFLSCDILYCATNVVAADSSI